MTEANDQENGRGRGAVWLGLLLLLTLAPIPFGSNRPWAWSLMGLFAALLLAGWTIAYARGRRALTWHRAVAVPLLLIILVCCWIGLSIVPGVPFPHPVWDITSRQLGVVLPGRITISVEMVLISLMRLLAYVTIFWLSFQYCRNRNRAEMLLSWISCAGLAFALYGLVNWLWGNPYLLWYPRWFGQDDVTSTFVNRNHYSTFANIGMLCSVGLAVLHFRNAWRLSDRSLPTLPRTIECLPGRPLFYFLTAIIIGMASLQTHSRMGGLSLIAAIFILLFLLMTTGLMRRGIFLWLGVPLVLLFLFFVSGAKTLQRLSETTDIDRLPIFQIAADQISSVFYTGSGYGTFAAAFAMYRDSRLPFTWTFTQAHSPYLEMAVELGVPAAIAFFGAILWLVGMCLLGAFRRRRDKIFPVVAVACAVAVGTHSLLDFGVQLPAIAALFAAVLGMGVSQSWSREHE